MPLATGEHHVAAASLPAVCSAGGHGTRKTQTYPCHLHLTKQIYLKPKPSSSLRPRQNAAGSQPGMRMMSWGAFLANPVWAKRGHLGCSLLTTPVMPVYVWARWACSSLSCLLPGLETKALDRGKSASAAGAGEPAKQ